MKVDRDGRGYISILAADKLMSSPQLYATFLLWLLSELFEQLPEVGDPEKPKLVFFFDEAHLLFNDAPAPAPAEDRAGRAPHPVEGRRRLFRDAEPPRRARYGPCPARKPRAACPARLYAARPEGRPGRRGNVSAQPEARHRPSDHRSSARARPLSLSSRATACRGSSSAPSCARPPPGSGRSRRRSGRRILASSPLRGKYEKTVDRESAFELLKKRAEEAAAAARQTEERPSRRAEGAAAFSIPSSAACSAAALQEGAPRGG